MFVLLLFVCKPIGEFKAKHLPVFMRDLVPDKPKTSENAFISAYSGDDSAGHYFALTLTCGYNLKLFNREIDRVLVISPGPHISEKRLEALKKVWTHIIVRKYVEWPKGCEEASPRDKHMWFKLQAWTVRGYKKLFWTGTDVVFMKDPSIVFNWPAPASVYDFHVWGFSRYGVVTNGDAILFNNDIRDYKQMLGMCPNFTSSPSARYHGARYLSEAWMGPYDMALMTSHFKDTMTTLPLYFQYELPGNVRSVYSRFETQQLSDNVVSVHYPVYMKPWRAYLPGFSEMWSGLAERASNYTSFPMNLGRMRIRRTSVSRIGIPISAVFVKALERFKALEKTLRAVVNVPK